MGTWENVKQLRLLASVTASDGVRQQFTTLFDYGVFDKFPRLKVRRARVGRRLDRLLARPHRRGLRPHVHRHPRAARAQAERLLPRARAGSRAIPTSARSPRSSSGSATGSCGRRTSRTPTTRPSTSPTSTSSPRAFPEPDRDAVPRRQRPRPLPHHRVGFATIGDRSGRHMSPTFSRGTRSRRGRARSVRCQYSSSVNGQFCATWPCSFLYQLFTSDQPHAIARVLGVDAFVELVVHVLAHVERAVAARRAAARGSRGCSAPRTRRSRRCCR